MEGLLDHIDHLNERRREMQQKDKQTEYLTLSELNEGKTPYQICYVFGLEDLVDYIPLLLKGKSGSSNLYLSAIVDIDFMSLHFIYAIYHPWN